MKATPLPQEKILAIIEAKDLNKKVIETYEVIERTFFAKTLRLNSAERKRVNKNFIHSNTIEDWKIALRIKSTGGTLGYKTKEEAISAARNLAGMKLEKSFDEVTRFLPKSVIQQLKTSKC